MAADVEKDILAHCVGCFSNGDENKGILKYGETMYAIVFEGEVVGVLCGRCLGKIPIGPSSWRPEEQFRVFKAYGEPNGSREYYDAESVCTQGLPLAEVTKDVLVNAFGFN